MLQRHARPGRSESLAAVGAGSCAYGVVVNEGTFYLTRKTKTWRIGGYCDRGPYTFVGKVLTLTDECGDDVFTMEEVKKERNHYYGPVTEGTVIVDYNEVIKK